MRHNIARNAADGGYTKKFAARNVAEVGRNSTAAILRATILGVDTRCNLAIAHSIARNIAPCIRTLNVCEADLFCILGNASHSERSERPRLHICYLPGGRSVWEKTVPEVLSTARGRRPRAVLKTKGTVFSHTDRPSPVNNIFIFFLQ